MNKPHLSSSSRPYPAPGAPDSWPVPSARRARRPSLIGGILRWLTSLMRFVLATVLFSILMVLASYFVVDNYIRGEEVKAPNLAGMPLLDAMNLLGKDDLSIKLAKGEGVQQHESVPPGCIISQFPMPDSKIKRGTPIRVVVSDGMHQIPLPDLRGQSIIKAQSTLHNLGLNIGNISVISMPNTPGGTVLSTDPPGGSGVAPSGKVNILKSSSASQMAQTMPNLQGMKIEQAREALHQYSLFIAEERPVTYDGVQPGQVFRQDPAPGEPVTDTTRIIVSYAPAQDKTEAEPPPSTRADNDDTSPSELSDEDQPETRRAPPTSSAPAASTPASAKAEGMPSVNVDSLLNSSSPTAAPKTARFAKSTPAPVPAEKTPAASGQSDAGGADQNDN